MQPIRRCRNLLLNFLLLTFSSIALAQTSPAGVVIASTGKLFAAGPIQGNRDLQRGSAFFQGDTLTTDAQAKALLRFTDNSVISMRPGTSFRVDSYKFKTGNETDNKDYSTLLKGGMRVLTGAVAKRNPKAYKITTPVATVGVRGTEFTVVLNGTRLDPSLSIGCWQGRVVVNNDFGTASCAGRDVKNGQRKYVHVASAGSAPEGLNTAPAGIYPFCPI